MCSILYCHSIKFCKRYILPTRVYVVNGLYLSVLSRLLDEDRESTELIVFCDKRISFNHGVKPLVGLSLSKGGVSPSNTFSRAYRWMACMYYAQTLQLLVHYYIHVYMAWITVIQGPTLTI